MKKTLAHVTASTSLGIAVLLSSTYALADDHSNQDAVDQPSVKEGLDKAGLHEKRIKHRRNYYKSMDTNEDGIISKDEYMAKAEARFIKKDKNGDGQLTKDELKKKKRIQKNTEASGNSDSNPQ